MKQFGLIILLIGLLSLSACTIASGNEPVPTVDVLGLNERIAALQSEVNASKQDSVTIQTLKDQIATLQKTIDDAKALDDSDWIYPGKVVFGDYVVGTTIVYTIRIHNGSDESKTFLLTTEPYSTPDIAAKAPKSIAEWVNYDGFQSEVLTLSGKETKDVLMQFTEPLDGRFYSITEKGLIDSIGQNDIMAEFLAHTTLPKSDVEAKWAEHIKPLMNLGLITTDSTYQFITTYGEYQSKAMMQTRASIRWIINMSEFSK